MSRLKSILFFTVLVLIAATAAALAHARANQKLGAPGVATRPIPGSPNLEVLLPPEAAGFQSVSVPQPEIVTNSLPRDTSFGQRVYTAADGFQVQANVVLMGSSRSSIHKPQICMTAQGWNIDDSASHVVALPMVKPVSYELPVMRLIATRQGQLKNGQTVTQRGVYVYWFVDADRFTPSHQTRMLWMAQDVVFKNELDRWAYISFFARCLPGQEEATFDRMKQLIVAAVPEFQLVPPGAK
ncbi:MAG TPA: exosortase-associated EpsI family protein [Candidatus Acidoferrales bacterium]|nr:exosortase-associated EpsI family protein [Candidatus Acidoferrales bacterium]